MKRTVINLFALGVIALGGAYLASPADAARPDISPQAKCGTCEGVCCGTNADGTCWASDKCAEADN